MLCYVILCYPRNIFPFFPWNLVIFPGMVSRSKSWTQTSSASTIASGTIWRSRSTTSRESPWANTEKPAILLRTIQHNDDTDDLWFSHAFTINMKFKIACTGWMLNLHANGKYMVILQYTPPGDSVTCVRFGSFLDHVWHGRHPKGWTQNLSKKWPASGSRTHW